MPGNPQSGYDPSFHPSLPQQLRRPDWDPSSYWVQPPRTLPPAPAFSAYVPPAEAIAFGDEKRDLSRFQALQAASTAAHSAPTPPIAQNTAPQHVARPEWALRDYTANQFNLASTATPILPIVNGPLFPQHNARPDWALRDYAANQQWLAPLLFITPTALVAPAEFFAFGELPRDMTALRLALIAQITQGKVIAGIPTPFTQVAIALRDRDMTAERFVIDFNRPTYLAIPQVPIGDNLAAFDYDPIDMTPYLIAASAHTVPASRIPYVFPNPVPYVQPPGWTLAQYQQIQDAFSALATPPIHPYPAGLKPYFPIEALIRDIPRATLLVQTFLLPPPPPRVIPQPPPYIEWQDWKLSQYQAYQDQFSALASTFPVQAGFRVMAVTAGEYGGLFYQPGDVFDLVLASDYSDSTINYQFAAGITVYGWMLKISPTTPLGQAAVGQEFFVIPDPNRRYIM